MLTHSFFSLLFYFTHSLFNSHILTLSHSVVSKLISKPDSPDKALGTISIAESSSASSSYFSTTRNVVIFVVGGLTFMEAAALEQLRESMPNVSLTIGGNTMLNRDKYASSSQSHDIYLPHLSLSLSPLLHLSLSISLSLSIYLSLSLRFLQIIHQAAHIPPP